jgi:hypothetical protein
MKRHESKILLLTLAVAAAGCAQTKGTALPAKRAERMTVEGSVEAPYKPCTRGILRGMILRNWASEEGTPYAKGKGFMTKAPLPDNLSASYIMGDDPRDKAKSAAAAKVEYANLGNELAIKLGASAVKEKEGLAQVDAKSLNLITTSDRGDLTVSMKKEEGTNVFTGTQAISKNLLEGEGNASASGVGSLRSFVIQSKKLNKSAGSEVAMNLPTDIEKKDGGIEVAAGKLGEPIKVAVTSAPQSSTTASWFTVEVREPAEFPQWAAIYRTPDTGQSEITVPTTWTKGSMKAGKVWVMVSRSNLVAQEMADGGNFCTETAMGSVVATKIEAADKK